MSAATRALDLLKWLVGVIRARVEVAKEQINHSEQCGLDGESCRMSE